jgi:Transposase, Mutator family
MLAHTLDEDADFVVRAMGEQGSGAAVLVVYRRDYDVPPSGGLRTVGYHLALVRRVAERRPDVQFVTYDRHLYRHWLGSRPDTAAMRNAWAASRVSGRRKAVKALDTAVAAFHRRPLQNCCKVLMLDGVVLARKTGAGALRRPVLVALGLRPDGKRKSPTSAWRRVKAPPNGRSFSPIFTAAASPAKGST